MKNNSNDLASSRRDALRIAFIFGCIGIVSSASASSIRLAPVNVRGMSVPELMDSELGSVEAPRRLDSKSGGGTVSGEMKRLETSTIQSYGGQPGSLEQVRGAGRSANELDVQAFGVSLNPPQGGGFDFSTFPSFLWWGYQNQVGVSSGSFDPRANSGVLRLKPWTVEALEQPGSLGRFIQTFQPRRQTSGGTLAQSRFAELAQTSAAYKSAQGQAISAGYSAGKSQGPSGILSWQWGEETRPVRGRVHFLGSNLLSEVTGPQSARTPRATQRTARAIPVVEVEAGSRSSVYYKSAFLMDALMIKNENPDGAASARTLSHSFQAGQDSVLIVGDTKIAASAKTQSYEDLTTTRQTQGVLQGQLSHLIRWQHHGALEPQIGIVSVSGYSVAPKVMLTWGAEPETMDRTYIRVSYSSKFPSLLDRYYQSAFYSGNPDLKVERDWTFQTGLERQWRSDGQRFVFAPDGLFQWRRDAQVTSGYPTARNVGDSWLATARLRLEYQPDSLLEFGMNGARHSSRVVETGDPFPYQPRWTGLIYAEVHDDPIQERWMGRLYGRGATESMVTPGGADLPDAWVMGVKADWVLSRDFNNLDVRLSLDVDNIWARSIEWVRDYPSEGRVWTLGLEARF